MKNFPSTQRMRERISFPRLPLGAPLFKNFDFSRRGKLLRQNAFPRQHFVTCFDFFDIPRRGTFGRVTPSKGVMRSFRDSAKVEYFEGLEWPRTSVRGPFFYVFAPEPLRRRRKRKTSDKIVEGSMNIAQEKVKNKEFSLLRNSLFHILLQCK